MTGWDVSGRPVCFWSTYRFEKGEAVANNACHLFSTPLGEQGQGFGRALSRAETNLRERSSTSLCHPVVFYRLRWNPCWDGKEGLSDLERLALTGRVEGRDPNAPYTRLWHPAAVAPETMQFQVSVSPALDFEVPIVWQVPRYRRFSLRVDFGTSAPPMPEGCRLKAILDGVSVAEEHVDATVKAFGAKYRQGDLLLRLTENS